MQTCKFKLTKAQSDYTIFTSIHIYPVLWQCKRILPDKNQEAVRK